MNRFALSLFLAVAACSPAAERKPAADETKPAAAGQPAAPVPKLAGNWQVTAANGQPLDQIFKMTASAASDRLTVRSDCVTLSWSYTQDKNVVAFSGGRATECPRGRTKNEVEVEKAVGAANIALFSNEGGEVQLSGSGGTVTMVRR